MTIMPMSRMIRYLAGLATACGPWLLSCAHSQEMPSEAPASVAEERPLMSARSSHHLPPAQVHGVGPWTRFQAADSPLDFTFEYPGNWRLGTERGRRQPYWQAIILGPRNPADTFSTSLVIRRLPTKASGGAYEDLDALMAARRKQFAGHQDFALIEEGERPLLGATGRFMRFSYRVTPPVGRDQTRAIPTTIVSTIVWLALGEQLHELSYQADVVDVAAYQPVYDHLLESLATLAK